mgnify:CR=1 FL=1
MVNAYAAIDISSTEDIVPTTVLNIEINKPFNKLSCLKTSLKLSNVNSLGIKYTPPLAASFPELNAKASMCTNGKIMMMQSKTIKTVFMILAHLGLCILSDIKTPNLSK